ncbi:MAG: helix-turn-helix transcriptional regulator [Thermoleophilia bacterium]|nr:helix-turn-helix transcriptional regulator [Thermoleophilia bacterium]
MIAVAVAAPTAPTPLPEPLVELVAQRFRVLAEPMRIRLLDLLRAGEASVQDLTGTLGSSQQNVSKHLGVLHQAGIVTRRKEGNHVFYSISDESVFSLCALVCGGLERQAGELAGLLAGSAEASLTRADSGKETR